MADPTPLAAAVTIVIAFAGPTPTSNMDTVITVKIGLLKYLRNVSAPDDARRLGLVLDADMLLCTPRCVGL